MVAGVRSASKPPSQCPQPKVLSVLAPDVGGFSGAEDCLYLMVYSPSGGSTKPKPVMLFVHGGALIQGSAYEDGAYDGSILAKKHDVVDTDRVDRQHGD